MTFHPEALEAHARELERVFAMLDEKDADLGAKTAVVMAIIAAVGAFLEGSLREVGDTSVRSLSAPDQSAWVKAAERGLWPMWEALRDRICPALGKVWQATSDDEAEFRELKELRNDVAHGIPVEPVRLKLLEPIWHRIKAHGVLRPVYKSLGAAPPVWWH